MYQNPIEIAWGKHLSPCNRACYNAQGDQKHRTSTRNQGICQETTRNVQSWTRVYQRVTDLSIRSLFAGRVSEDPTIAQRSMYVSDHRTDVSCTVRISALPNRSDISERTTEMTMTCQRQGSGTCQGQSVCIFP